MADPLTINPSISKRSINKLAELQHQLGHELSLLTAQHSRLMGALMACDAATQRGMMLEYRDQLHVVHSILSKLCMILDRYGDTSQE